MITADKAAKWTAKIIVGLLVVSFFVVAELFTMENDLRHLIGVSAAVVTGYLMCIINSLD